MAAYDAIVIGSGTAGSYLAERLARSGMKVAAIERKLIGGTCLNVGCTPTKTLVASAYAAHMARRGSEYGVQIDGPVAVDMKRVKARKDAVVAARQAGLEAWLRNTENCTVYQDHARFESPRKVRVGTDVLTAERIFLDVGGRAAVPPVPGLDRVSYLTNVSMLDIDFLPAHLLIVGGSYIGLEFAQIYRRFGSEVTVTEMGPRLIQHEDEDVSAAVLDILEKGRRSCAAQCEVHRRREAGRQDQRQPRLRGCSADGERNPFTVRRRTPAQHGRSGPGGSGCAAGQAWIHRCR